VLHALPSGGGGTRWIAFPPDECNTVTPLRGGGVGTVEHACVRIYAYHGQSKLEIDLSHWYHEGIDLLFTIRTLNRVVDSKVSSWDPKLAADCGKELVRKCFSQASCYVC